VLVGRAPEDAPADLPTELPELPPLAGTGSPDDLEDHRPDLRAAQARFTSSWQRRLATERAFLPRLTVSASGSWNVQNDAGQIAFGGGADTTAELFAAVATHRAVINQGLVAQGLEPLPDLTVPDTGTGTDDGITWNNWFNFNFGAAITIPIFNGGRNIASLKQARATERAATHALGQARLEALAQVETALVSEREQRTRLDLTRDRASDARLAFRAARDRYAEGVGDFLQLLTALVTAQVADLQAVQAHRDAITARIQLHEALGGTWTEDLPGGSR
jgi:outer membrane protein TolC